MVAQNALAALLRCPACGSRLDEKPQGFVCTQCKNTYPVVREIPRFAPQQVDEATRKTAESFGWEWTKGWNVSDRGNPTVDVEVETTTLLEKTQTKAEYFRGKLVLDAGCGMGRYSYVLRLLGAEVVALDLSDAVESAARNLRPLSGNMVVQASLFEPPLARDSFDFIFSVGVLHHTPDAKKGFMGLVPYLKHGGDIAIWVYRKESPERERVFRSVREITLQMPYDTLLQLCQTFALVAQGPSVPKESKNRVPISEFVHENFDWYSCALREHFSQEEVVQWFREAGLVDITTHGYIHADGYGGAIGVKGRRP